MGISCEKLVFDKYECEEDMSVFAIWWIRYVGVLDHLLLYCIHTMTFSNAILLTKTNSKYTVLLMSNDYSSKHKI